MKATVNFELTDYMNLAALVHDNAVDEPSTYGVKYTAGVYTLYLDVAHEFDTRTVRGGSYGGYQFERLNEAENEYYDILKADCLNVEGERVACNFSPNTLTNILNKYY